MRRRLTAGLAAVTVVMTMAVGAHAAGAAEGGTAVEVAGSDAASGGTTIGDTPSSPDPATESDETAIPTSPPVDGETSSTATAEQGAPAGTAPSDEPAAPTDPPRAGAVDVHVTWLDAGSGYVAAGGYVDVLETGGSCTLEANQGEVTLEVSTAAVVDASTTSCGTLELRDPALTDGEWSVTLRYASDGSHGAAPVRLVDPAARTIDGRLAPSALPQQSAGTEPAAVSELAAVTSSFDPSMIISDAAFYDYTSMTLSEIAAFIRTKNAACQPGSTGTPCLRDYVETTWTRAGDAACPGTYQGAANESAAAIIAKVATACRVNPQVLLVTLQKEQSLLTASGSYLTPTRYRSAMGYGCPDTAPCDAQYYGFFNQVYRAAWQFQRYRLIPTNYSFVAGRTVTINYHPNAACGGQPVYLRNQATAGLYNYTPYVPNQAILSGAANSCSSTGNLNFYNLYTSWFASAESLYPVEGAIRTTWLANQQLLGDPVGKVRTGLRDGGSVQNFERGSIYDVPSVGTFIVRGGIGTYWGSQLWENGGLGYPIGNEVALSRSGASQAFQGGTVYWSPVGGPQIVLGAIGSTWTGAGGVDGTLGYPTTTERALPGGGTLQRFEKGTLTWFPGIGVRHVGGGIAARWLADGTVLGAATTTEKALVGGAVQSFRDGAIYWSPAQGAHPVRGAILAYYGALRWENGPLGYPTSGEVRSGGLTVQRFQGGTITFVDATGAVIVRLG